MPLPYLTKNKQGISLVNIDDLVTVFEDIKKYRQLLEIGLELGECCNCDTETEANRLRLLINCYLSNLEAELDVFSGVLRDLKQDVSV